MNLGEFSKYNPSCVLRIAGATLLWWPVLNSGFAAFLHVPPLIAQYLSVSNSVAHPITFGQISISKLYLMRISLRIHHNCRLYCSHEFRLLDYVYLLHMYRDSPSHCSTISVVFPVTWGVRQSHRLGVYLPLLLPLLHTFNVSVGEMLTPLIQCFLVGKQNQCTTKRRQPLNSQAPTFMANTLLILY